MPLAHDSALLRRGDEAVICHVASFPSAKHRCRCTRALAMGLRLGLCRASVRRSRHSRMGRTSQKLPMCRNVGDGETRTRTGDTTIFRDPVIAQTRSKRPANRRIGVGRLVPDAFALGWVSACLGLRGRAEVPKPRHQARQLESAGVRPGARRDGGRCCCDPVTVVWPRAGFAPMKRGRPHRVDPADRRPARMTQPRGDRTRQARGAARTPRRGRAGPRPPRGHRRSQHEPEPNSAAAARPLVREGHIAHQLITRARRTPMLVRHRLRARCHGLFCSVTQAAVAAGDGSLRASAWAAAAAR
jgi:hypothetical protein